MLVGHSSYFVREAKSRREMREVRGQGSFFVFHPRTVLLIRSLYSDKSIEGSNFVEMVVG